eukprot:Skav221036  [mRNA]  locus=scaffold1448:145475:146276:- [translate_table: standard]
MNAATVQALRVMLREESAGNIEERITTNVGVLLDDLRGDCWKKPGKKQLFENRVKKLESSAAHDDLVTRLANVERMLLKERVVNDDAESVDKSMLDVGGFSNKPIQEAENLLNDLLKRVRGFKEVGGFAPKDVIVSDKVCRVHVRVDGKVVHMATFNEGCEVAWMNDGVVKQDARDALNAFMDGVEQDHAAKRRDRRNFGGKDS